MVDKTEIEEAKKVIKEGELVIFPTETAYGIAVDATNKEAVEKVYEAKQRPSEKGLTTIVSSLEQAERYSELSERERKIVEEFMPGPLTLVVDKQEEKLPENLNSKFVFRIPGSELCRKLAEEGPITATSANISGRETSYSIEDISDRLLDKVDYIIDRGELDRSDTSTIVEVNNGELELHRKGPVSREEIEEVV